MRIPRWSLLVLAFSITLFNPRAAFSQARPSIAVATAPSADDLATIREQLLALLRMSPTLVRIVEIDPSLLADQEYVTRSNPQLEQFLVQHPEVTRNPDFYLFGDFTARNGRFVESLRRRVNSDDASAEQQLRRQMLGTIMDILTFIGIVGSLLWLIRLFLQSRRWTRVFRMQSEVHSKLLDRFGNSGELLQYMNTESGKRFLEAAPIPTEFEQQEQRLPGGLGRVLASLQIGIVLALLGIGLLSLQHRLPDAAAPMLIFGMVALMPGIGFIISALITWRLSVRLGLLPEPVAPSSQPLDRQ